MEDKMIEVSKIGVDCVQNDPVDVSCNRSQYLGFDFFAKKEEVSKNYGSYRRK
ncbi:MAG: hypothetical protein RR189_02445 [Bacilli bacterium]